jgi:DNA-binding FrmR family transcriptional regulator
LTSYTPRGYAEWMKSKQLQNDKVVDQLKRIRGQIDGILNMYQDERGCIDIVRQVVAARSSLGRVARDMLSSEVTKCTKEKKTDEIDEIFKEVFRY